MNWPWWEQYDERADALDEMARGGRWTGPGAESARGMLHGAADDIRTLTDGLKSSRPGGPMTPEEVLAMLPRDSAHAKHLRESMESAKREEAHGRSSPQP